MLRGTGGKENQQQRTGREDTFIVDTELKLDCALNGVFIVAGVGQVLISDFPIFKSQELDRVRLQVYLRRAMSNSLH